MPLIYVSAVCLGKLDVKWFSQFFFLLSHQLKSSSLLSVFSALQHPQRGKRWEAGPAGDNARGQSHRPPHVC